MAQPLFNQLGTLQAGETFGPFSLSYDDYPRGDGWTLSLLVIGDSGQEIEVAATAGSGADEFSVTVASTTTASIRGGRKSFVVYANKEGTGKYVAERGAMTVLHSPATTTAEMTILASIRAVKAGLATDGQRTVVVDGIQLRNMTPAELDSWEARYIKIVNAQIANAGGNGGRYAIKMRTPQDNRFAAPWFAPSGSSR
jgi:hypothetical protein